MDFKRVFLIAFLFLVLLSTVAVVSADDSYSISKAHVDLCVLNDGLLQVDESYVYNFDGTFNGVYRDIPLKEGESIENVKVWADGAYPVLEQTSEDGKEHLKIYLYADSAHTKKISDCTVTVYIQYDMKNVVTVFNDVGALQYKLWGEEWDVGVGEVTAYIELPNGKGNEYYLNPEELTYSSSIDDNVISVESNSISKGKYYELLVLMPVDDFSSSPYAKHVDSDGREMILKNLEDSKNSQKFWGSVTWIAEIFSLIFVPFSAIGTYLKYGREPKVNYDGIYEREPPTDDPPAVVNAMIDSDTFATPNKKGFEATIMDLIDRKVFSIHKENDDLFLTVNEGADNLDKAESIVVDIINHFANKGVLNLTKLDDRMDSESNAKWFLDHFESWQTAVEEEYLSEDIQKRYFDDTGTVIAQAISLLGMGLGIVFVLIFLFFDFEGSTTLLVIGVAVAVFSYFLLNRRDDIFGRWTEEGRVIYLKWKNFKKFLNDNSLMKEHPPESIVVWKKYLIYATSLGVAKSVEKAMNLQIPNVHDYDDGVFMYHYYGYHTFYHSYDSAHSTTTSSDSGSFGSVGGGSGGGGGGAF
ncbi:DUF2207 domain-containing protein [uncultured Methanobrevibacter sp.]|uniref:DUF2207 domain-containing protein n=1 Tax=uncultured Methanobrevibacter sp. TaxID=253161 RepID=UPI00262FE353|nr:DUF2207 domain-containing protein [uncultured Methanobrevibacter sp.]